MVNIPIGPAVEELRLKRAWTQEELARKAKIKTDTLRTLLQNSTKTRLRTITEVARALGTTAEALNARALELLAATQTAPSDPRVVGNDRQFLRLQNLSRLVSNRTNIVRDERGLPLLTLGDNLYVKRIVEDGIVERLASRGSDVSLIVVEGEPGTGKSSLLWSLRNTLTERAFDAWLIDAVELATVFGGGDTDGKTLSEEFRTLFRAMVQLGRSPILLIDTADVVINQRGMEIYFESLLMELQDSGVSLVIASRPGEAHRLHILDPFVAQLFDCPSSGNLRLIRRFEKRGSGSSGLEFKRPAVDAASDGLRWWRV